MLRSETLCCLCQWSSVSPVLMFSQTWDAMNINKVKTSTLSWSHLNAWFDCSPWVWLLWLWPALQCACSAKIAMFFVLIAQQRMRCPTVLVTEGSLKVEFMPHKAQVWETDRWQGCKHLHLSLQLREGFKVWVLVQTGLRLLFEVWCLANFNNWFGLR